MALLVTTSLLSVIFLACAAWLLVRADSRPPDTIRSESGRSQEEYAFRQWRMRLRRFSMLCGAAGAANLVAVAWLAIARTH